ncbi:MAG: methionine biosynthesis protein MetW [Propionibacteriaceae bacterium]|jgi:methionine biosynthesis protein MetW|nr:methionine biosynthesis protein MetW [Propionibacteriaceae bacterium]
MTADPSAAGPAPDGARLPDESRPADGRLSPDGSQAPDLSRPPDGARPTDRLRRDLALLGSLIPPGARVLDLGCGHGSLLRHLQAERGCVVQGVEIDDQSVLTAIRRGVPVIELDIDHELNNFDDQAYDVVVLSKTVQAVRRPAEVLRQMARIAPRSIVSMPNFAHWRNGLRLLAGHAPVSKDLPYAWHDSPNVHFGSLADLEELFAGLGLKVERCIPLDPAGRRARCPLGLRNWLASAALYELSGPPATAALARPTPAA